MKSEVIDCLENDKKWEEALEIVVSAGLCLLDLCSSFSIAIVEILNFVFCKQGNGHNSFRDEASSFAVCKENANRTLQQNSLKVQFQPVKIRVDRNALNIKRSVVYCKTTSGSHTLIKQYYSDQ